MSEEETPELQVLVEVDNAASTEGIARKLKRVKRASDRAAEFWKQALSNEVGRAELWGILQDCHAFETRFACGPNGFPQPEATWFEAGKQDVGQRLFFTLTKHDRAGAFLMLDEHDPRFAKPKRSKADSGD